MFNTEGQEAKQSGGLSKSLEAGVRLAHIHSARVKTSAKGTKALELTLETPEIPGFEGWAIDKENPEGPKYKGQTARVSATIYTAEFNSNDATKNEILNKILVMANELGLRKQVDNISKTNNIQSIEEWVEKAVEVLKDQDMYWFLAGKEDEYNGKTIVRLQLPKYKFCSTLEEKLNKFDKNNKYHYQALSNETVQEFKAAGSDFDL